MKDAVELEFEELGKFAPSQVFFPYIAVSSKRTEILFSKHAEREMKVSVGDRFKLSKSKDQSIYLYRDEWSEDKTDRNKVRVFNDRSRLFSKQLTDVIYKEFGLDKKLSHRLYCDIFGEWLQLKTRDNTVHVVKGHRICFVPHISKIEK